MIPRTRRFGGPWVRGWRWLLLVGVSTIVLLPALRTGYILEDGVHSLFRGMARFHGDGILGRLDYFVSTNLVQGRFYPLTQILHTGVHYVAGNAATYKLLLLAGTVLDVLLFALLLRRVSGNAGFACLAGLLTVGLYQFRVHFDPVLGFYLQMQLILAGQFASLIALQLYLEGRGRRWLAASALAFLVILLTYEICYTFVLMQVLLILKSRESWRARLTAVAPFFLVALACGLALVWVRSHALADHYVQDMRFHPRDTPLAFGYQISAALPLSYLWADPHKIFGAVLDAPALIPWLLRTDVIALALAVLGWVYLILRTQRDGDHARLVSVRRLMLRIGLLLVVLPPLLTSVSPFHLRFLAPGLGWVHVLIQCHGIGLLLATLIWTLLAQRPLGGGFARWKCLVASLAIAAAVGLTYRANLDVVTQFNERTGHHVRQNIEAALEAGLLDEVPDHAILHLAHEYGYWHDAIYSLYFYAQHTNRVLVPVAPSARVPDSTEFHTLGGYLAAASIDVREDRAYHLRDVCLDARSGYVVLSGIDADGARRAGNADQRAVRLFVRHPHLFRTGSVPAFLLVGAPSPPEAEAEGSKYLRFARDMELIRSGRDWGLFSLRVATAALDPDSIDLRFNPVEVAALIRAQEESRQVAGEPAVQVRR